MSNSGLFSGIYLKPQVYFMLHGNNIDASGVFVWAGAVCSAEGEGGRGGRSPVL